MITLVHLNRRVAQLASGLAVVGLFVAACSPATQPQDVSPEAQTRPREEQPTSISDGLAPLITDPPESVRAERPTASFTAAPEASRSNDLRMIAEKPPVMARSLAFAARTLPQMGKA